MPFHKRREYQVGDCLRNARTRKWWRVERVDTEYHMAGVRWAITKDADVGYGPTITRTWAELDRFYLTD